MPVAGSALSHVEHSSSMELMIETAFLADLLQESWFGRNMLVDVLHSTVDAFGYDVVLQCGEVTRHVQLKAKRRGGTTSKYAINTLLVEQPAGCVICVEWEVGSDHRLELSYRWFGNGPGEPLSGLGDRVSRHSRGDAKGVKKARERMRDVKLSSFRPVDSMPKLLDLLFVGVSSDG